MSTATTTTTRTYSTSTRVLDLQPGDVAAWYDHTANALVDGQVVARVVAGEDDATVIWTDGTSTDFALLDQVMVVTVEDVDATPRPGDAKRAEAQAARQRAADSWDRSDTDGYLSQWASGVTAARLDAEARLLDAGGTAEYPALFDAATGQLVAAKQVTTKYGETWALLTSDDPTSRYDGFVNESTAATPEKRRAAMRRKGYTLGTVRAAAEVRLTSGIAPGPYCHRTDGGFSRDVVIVEPETIGWY